jgi:gliding motility-associated-like protein
MVKLFWFLLFQLLAFSALATHNRSGEITYKHLGGNTYEFTITTCTKWDSEANKDKLEIKYGDGHTDTLPRVQFFDYPATNTKKNIYRGTHTYTGPGTYLITMEDPNRNSNVLNINNSVSTVFCIQTKLIISPFLGSPNNSLQFDDCPCPENACTNQPWLYNLGAFDPDGDSLSYSIIPCKGQDCLDLAIPAAFQYPQDVGGGSLNVDPITGTVTWSSPGIQGEYNFAIKVTEYRGGAEIGYVIRDMQVTVKGSCGNAAPVVSAFNDTCVQVDSTIVKILTASDSPASPGDVPVLSWDYFGQGFNLSVSPATFIATSPAGNPISGQFEWTPGCSAVSETPYIFTFEASDNGPNVALKSLRTVRVRVNGPPVQNLQISANLSAASLSWNMADCPNVIGYNIYRKSDSSYIANSCCGAKEPINLGYKLIGKRQANDSISYTDIGPLVPGNKYCYTVTAVYPNGAESCMVPPVCVSLPFDLPIITNVSVDSTDFDFGIDSIRWTHPRELDTTLYTGPYQYRLFSGEEYASPNTLVYTSNIATSLSALDTFFVDSNIRTTAFQYQYQVELLNNGVAVGRSAVAASIYIKPQPVDNGIQLNWEDFTPWNNFKYEVYKSPAIGQPFVLIATVDTNFFAEYNLVNGVEQCYKIRSVGRYSLNTLPDTLYNWSQYICAAAFDYTAPCAPGDVSIVPNCENLSNLITWNNPNNSCSDDVVAYQLYYSPTKDGPFEQIETIYSDMDTSYLYQSTNSIAGCYYVTASDSVTYNNVSPPSQTVCVDNCEPVYNLPNVFTPNGDGPNDVYHALLPYKFISHVDFRIFNRWGDQVYFTEDPMINWNGFDQKQNKLVTEGVYFYVCKVYAIKLEGTEPYELQGFIHVIYDK